MSNNASLQQYFMEMFEKYSDQTVFELIVQTVVRWERQLVRKGLVSPRDIPYDIERRFDNVDLPDIEKRLGGTIDLTPEDIDRFSEQWAAMLMEYPVKEVVESLVFAVRDWLVTTDLPHFTEPDEERRIAMGRFLHYLNDNWGIG